MMLWDQLLLLLTVEFLAKLTADVLLWENGYYANRSFVFLWMLKLTRDGVRTSRGPRGCSCPGAGAQPGCSEAQGYPELDDGHRCCIPIYKSSQQQGRVSLPAMSREHWQSSLPGKKWHLTTPTCTGGMSVTRIAVAHNLTQPISVLQSLSQSHTEAHTDAPLLWISICTHIHTSLDHHHPLIATLIAFHTFSACCWDPLLLQLPGTKDTRALWLMVWLRFLALAPVTANLQLLHSQHMELYDQGASQLLTLSSSLLPAAGWDAWAFSRVLLLLLVFVKCSNLLDPAALTHGLKSDHRKTREWVQKEDLMAAAIEQSGNCLHDHL